MARQGFHQLRLAADGLALQDVKNKLLALSLYLNRHAASSQGISEVAPTGGNPRRRPRDGSSRAVLLNPFKQLAWRHGQDAVGFPGVLDVFHGEQVLARFEW